MARDCEECKKRRAALIAAAKRMAEWMRHPIGPPPVDFSQRPNIQTKDKTEKSS